MYRYLLFGHYYLTIRRRIGPRLNARTVAVAYPRMPINKAGMINCFHSFACAMAAAVVGPPTFALLAKYNSRLGSLNIPLPTAIRVAKCIPIWSAEKANKEGAFSKTIRMDPAAPEHAKNIWTKTTPNAVPVSLSFEKKAGKAVAATTVNAEIKGREDVPAGSKAFVRNEPTVTKVDATETEIASVGRVIVEGDDSSSTAISDIVAIFWS